MTVYESGGDLFNVDDLKTICDMEDRIVRSTPGFNAYCSCFVQSAQGYRCGPSLSLGTYIASIRNHSRCSGITQADVRFAKNLLETCAPAYFADKLSDTNDPDTPKECTQNKDFIKNVFDLLVDVDFLRNTKILKTTLALSPRYYDTDFARDLYDQHLSGDWPEQNGVKLVGFSFDDFKFDQFNLKLVMDAVFPAIGFVIVALILLLYTHSVLVMALTIFSIITATIIAYFIYHQIFRLTFFPFLNILTFIFLVGIGADDAFVFNDVWSQAKRSLPDGNVVDWIEYTLKRAALSMFVTSFTTSAAFYANVVSDITAIRLFGIFSGTSILIMYSLMITWFPAGVVFMEKRRNSRNVHVEMELQTNPAIVEQSTDKTNPKSDDGKSSPSPSSKSTNEVVQSVGTTQPSSQALPFRCYNTVRSKCSKFMRDLFEKWIPTTLRGYPIWLIALLALGVGMICAVTVSPGLQRPKSSDFQVFASSHILEQYDLKYKSKFRLAQTVANNFYVFVFFGFKAEDDGNYLDPKNFGELEYDNSLDVLQPDAQKWFFEDLCSEIRKQKFFGQNISWDCYPEVICFCGLFNTFQFC